MKKHYENEMIDNPDFIHEVPSHLVEEQTFDEKKKGKRFIILILIILLLSLLLVGLGIFLLSSSIDDRKMNPVGADLFVVHSKTAFGDIIDNFQKYNSLDNAFEYTFYVDNQNNFDVWYKVKLVDSYDETNKFKYKKSNINYAIEKNGNIIFKGFLDSNKEIILNSAKIRSGNKDDYKLKFWSSNFEGNGYYKFKINVQF